MDTQLLLTLCGMVLAIVGINIIALIGCIRSDMRSIESKISSDMRGIESKISSDMKIIQRNIESMQASIQAEMKDFHGRLCAIEERRRRD